MNNTFITAVPVLPSKRYQIVSKIGSGASSHVYLGMLKKQTIGTGTLAKFPQQVAVKCIQRSHLKIKGPESVERILQEVTIVLRCFENKVTFVERRGI